MLPAHEHAEVARIDALIDHLFRRGREHRHGQIHLAPVQQTGDVGQVGPLVDQVDLGVLQQKMLQEGGVVRHADDGEGLGPSAVLDAGVQE